MSPRAAETFPLLVVLLPLLIAWLPVRVSYFLWTKRPQFTFGDWFMATFALGVALAFATLMANP